MEKFQCAAKRPGTRLPFAGIIECDHVIEEVVEVQVTEPQPCLTARCIGDHGKLDPTLEDCNERHVDMRVGNKSRLASTPVGNDAGGEYLVVDLLEYIVEKLVEHFLELNAPLLIDCIDAVPCLGGSKPQSRIDHRIDRRGDCLLLHAHEIDERVVEIENDGFDHIR